MAGIWIVPTSAEPKLQGFNFSFRAPVLEYFLSSGNKAKKKSVFEVFPKPATRDTELKCRKNCQNFYSYPWLLSDRVGNTELLCPMGWLNSFPACLNLSCLLGGIYWARGSCWGFCISSYWSSSWTMNHLFKPQPKEVDRRVGPPVWGAPGPWLRVCFSWSFEWSNWC